MSKFMLVISFILSQSLLANDFIGGVLETKDGKRKVGITCAEKSEATGKCQEYQLMATNPNWAPEWYVANTYISESEKDIAKRVYKEHSEFIRSKIKSAYMVATAAPFIYCIWPTNSVPLKTRLIACPLLPVGVAVDIAKSPAVAVGHLAVSPVLMIQSFKAKRYVKYLFNVKKKGKAKKISKKYMRSFIFH